MGDVFDDFLDELKRRQASGGRSGRLRRVGPDDPGPGGPDDGGDGNGGRGGPRPFRRGGGGRPSGIRRYTIIWIVGVVLLLLVVFGRGLLDLWTDVLWYRSVGYEQVLLTRLGAQAGLFVLGGLIAAVMLFGNVWLAGRLAVPPPDGSRGIVRGWIDRLNQAASDRPGGASWRSGFGGQYAQPTVDFEFPDGVRIGRYVLVGFAVLVILGAAAASSGAWETILLWQNRVPFSPTGAPVVDPIFHRDIGFFLFELPFLRLLQSFLVGLLVTTLLLVVARYFLSAVAAGLDLTPRVRLHVGVLAALVLLGIT